MSEDRLRRIFKQMTPEQRNRFKREIPTRLGNMKEQDRARVEQLFNETEYVETQPVWEHGEQGWRPPPDVTAWMRPEELPQESSFWQEVNQKTKPKPNVFGELKNVFLEGKKPAFYEDPAFKRLQSSIKPALDVSQKVATSPVGGFLEQVTQLPVWPSAPAAGGLLGMAKKIPKKLPSENPYLKMPLERVRQDAEKGVNLAKEALEARKGKTPEAIGQVPQPAKESWQMTKDEFIAKPPQTLGTVVGKATFDTDSGKYIWKPKTGKGGGYETPDNIHRMEIVAALKENKPVPPEVLKDYPDLKPPPAVPEAKVTPEVAKPNGIPVTETKSPVTQPGAPEVSVAENVPPVVPPKPSVNAGTSGESPLSKMQKALQGKPQKTRDWGDTYLKIQEYLNDSTYGLRRMQRVVSKSKKIAVGSSEDIVTAITRAPGAANAGLARYEMAVSKMKQLAPDANVTDISTVLQAEHGKGILVAKGKSRVLPGGVNTQAELDQVLRELELKLGVQKYQQLRKAAEVVKEVYASERQRLVNSGLISQELGDALAQKYPWYNPLKYVEYAETQAAMGKRVKPFSNTTSGLQRLGEVGSEGAIVDPLTALPEQLIKNEVRIQRNELAQGIIKVGLQDKKLGIIKTDQEGINTLSFLVNGEKQTYSVPNWMYREAVTLTQSINNPLASLMGALNGVHKAAFTSFSPVFTVANIFNDLLPALVRGGVLPTETARRLALGFKSLENDKILQAFALSGAKQARFYGQDAYEIAKQVGASGGKVIGKNFDFKKAVRDAIPALGSHGEQAPRQAVFEKVLNKTLPNWRNMTVEAIAASPQGRKAAADAVEATINFGRGGYLIRSANPFILFLNASMEGTKLPFRALKESARAKWTLAGLGAGMAGLASYNMSYPEYFDVPDRVRWGTVMVMLPSVKKDIEGKSIPRYLTVIPNTREWASFFAPIVYSMEKVSKDSPEDFKQFALSILPQVSPISSVPLPPLALELVQQLANYDIYSGYSIIPRGKENLPSTQQTGPYVSSSVEKAAQATGQSPLRVQHVVSSLFGGAGSTITSVADLVVGAKNKQGLELKERYDTQSVEKRTSWVSNLSPTEKEALALALKQPSQTIPVVTPVINRFYRQRGGQLVENDWHAFNNSYQEALQKTTKFLDMARLGVNFAPVGDSMSGIDLSLKDRTQYQTLAGNYAEQELGTLTQSASYLKASDAEKRKLIQGSLEVAREKAREELAPTLGAISKARYDIVKRGGSITQFEKVTGLKWDDPKAEKLITGAHRILKEYWDIESNVWSEYDPRLKQLSDAIEEIEKTDTKKAKEYLFRNPKILWARKEVLLEKKSMRFKKPILEEILNLFY